MAVMILRWTLFAVRPLQVKELAEALVVSGDDLEEYLEDDLPDSWQDGFVDEDYVRGNDPGQMRVPAAAKIELG